MQIAPCKVCRNVEGNGLYTVREMQFGLREEFIYQLCANCGCMQLQNIPDDLSRHYPTDYYSFNAAFTLETPTALNRLRADYLIHKKNRLAGALKSFRFKRPLFFEWLRIPQVRQTDKILDVGTGNGSLLAEFYKYGFTNLEGIDPFIPADKKYNEINIYKRDVFQLTEQYDYIMLHHSFEHMNEPLTVLHQLYKHLKKGRYLLIRIPVMGNHGWKRYGVNWVALDAPRHLLIYSEKSMQLLAEQTGFEVRKIVYDDVDAFSIWASEQYERDIPLQDRERSYAHNSRAGVFSEQQMQEFRKRSDNLRSKGESDQAAFYLYKS